jgi:hypothetical protein
MRCMKAVKLFLILPRLLAALSLAGMVILQSGCLVIAAGAAGAGTVAYIRGELDATLGNKYDAVVQATNGAITQLQFVKVGDKKDALSAELTARTAEDKKVQITIKTVADNLTKVEIRVGFWGDETMSRTILDKIKSNL